MNTRFLPVSLVRPAAIGALCSTVAPIIALGALPPGRGSLLPITDRMGDPETAAVVETVLLTELSRHQTLSEKVDLRPILRRWRIRDLNDTSPRLLERLADELGVAWFFSATLHESLAGPPPRITLSARIQMAGDNRLYWAGFESASGLDEEGWLGRGGSESLGELAELVALRLTDRILGESTQGRGPKPRFGPARSGYLARSLQLSEAGPIAVIPFNSVSRGNPIAVADMVTQATIATLHELGASQVVPGLVTELQRQANRLSRGEVDPDTREGLRQGAAATWVLTGTVETFEQGTGTRPEPRIAFFARLIDIRSGRIEWIDGQERGGRDPQALFGRHRIYSAGSLALEMTRSLLAEIGESTTRESQ